jgi:hypothetical protein
MIDKELEKVYSEARHVLYRRGKKLGKPRAGCDGLRYCPVDGVLLTDHQLLEDAWGEKLAVEILGDIGANHSAPHGCAECEQLWREYSNATRLYLRIFIDRQIFATTAQDSAELERLAPILRQAAENRQSARRSVWEHGAHHVPQAA